MRRHTERGFTLVEVLVVVVISGFIVPALIAVVLIGLRTLDNTNARIAGSNDTLLVASYFTSDVQGASYMAAAGTRAHVSPAVTLPSDVTNVALLTIYALRGNNPVVAPPTGGTVWNAQAGAVTSSLADESLTINADNRNNTLARVGTTANPTSSITHTVALKAIGVVTRRGQTSNAVANGSSLVLQEPAAVVQNDVLVAHITAATTAANVTAPAGWVEKSRAELSGTLSSLVYVKTAGVTEPSSWGWGFGSGTHDVAGGIVAYTNVDPSASTQVAAIGSATNPCGGETPVLSITTADQLAVSSVGYFFQTVGTENQLARSACTAEGGQSTQILARNLQATAATTATCVPVSCSPLPASVSLTLREPPSGHDTLGRSYFLSARTRTG